MINKFLKYNTNNFKKYYSNFNKISKNLKRPIYFYVIGISGSIFLLNKLMIWNSNILVNYFCLTNFNLYRFRFQTLFTHPFVHFDIFDLFFNSLNMYFIGRAIEFTSGPSVLLKLIFFGSIFDGLLKAKQTSNYNQGTIINGLNGISASIIFYYLLNLSKGNYVHVFPIPIAIPPALIYALIGYTCFKQYTLKDPRGWSFGGLLAGLLVFRKYV